MGMGGVILPVHPLIDYSRVIAFEIFTIVFAVLAETWD
jgi:hypothetical protein